MNKKIFTILVGTMFISMLGFGIVVPLLPIYADQLGATPLEIGLINGGFSITVLVFLPVVGRLSDRIGRKVFLCSGLSCLIIASLGLIWAQNPLQLILVRCFQGLGASMHLPIAQAYLGDITPKGEEGRWMGRFNGVLFSAVGLGPLIGGLLTDLFSTSTTFLVMAALCAVGLIATIILLPEVPKKTVLERESAVFSSLRRSDKLKGAFTIQMANGFVMACMMTFLPLFASQSLGLSVSLIGLLIASQTPMALFQFYTGTLADKHSRRILVTAGGTAAVIFIALQPMANGFWPLLAMYVLMAVGIAFAIPSVAAYVVEEGRTLGMGTSMAMLMMAMQVGTGVGPIVLGGIVEFVGIKSAFYSAAGIMLIGVAVFNWFIRRQPG